MTTCLIQSWPCSISRGDFAIGPLADVCCSRKPLTVNDQTLKRLKNLLLSACIFLESQFHFTATYIFVCPLSISYFNCFIVLDVLCSRKALALNDQILKRLKSCCCFCMCIFGVSQHFPSTYIFVCTLSLSYFNCLFFSAKVPDSGAGRHRQ